MGILYGWTKEYLLNEMSFDQIVTYLNEGLRFKYPKPTEPEGQSGSSLIGADAETIRKKHAELRGKYLTPGETNGSTG